MKIINLKKIKTRGSLKYEKRPMIIKTRNQKKSQTNKNRENFKA